MAGARPFAQRAKPLKCPACHKKGVSPYTKVSSTGIAYNECRYCCHWVI